MVKSGGIVITCGAADRDTLPRTCENRDRTTPLSDFAIPPCDHRTGQSDCGNEYVDTVEGHEFVGPSLNKYILLPIHDHLYIARKGQG